MTPADAAIVAAAEERDAELENVPTFLLQEVAADRRELLRIISEQETLAGHRTGGEHDCFLMDCAHLGPEVEMLRSMIRERETQTENRRVEAFRAYEKSPDYQASDTIDWDIFEAGWDAALEAGR